MGAARGATAWRPTTKIKVSVRRPTALESGADPAEDLLPVEPDVIELPGPRRREDGDGPEGGQRA
jgi:hypothetical protein